MIKFKFNYFLLGLQAILLLGMASCLGNPANPLPHPTELATTPLPENSQPGGLEGIFISKVSIAGAQPERCYKLYRFYQDGEVLYADMACFDPSSNAKAWTEIDRWFNRENPQVLHGDYHRLKERIWIRVVGYDSIHEETYLRTFQGAYCKGQMVLQEPSVKTYSGVPSELTQPVVEYIKVQEPNSSNSSSEIDDSNLCSLSGFRFIFRPLVVVSGGEAFFQVQTSPGETCSMQYTTPDGQRRQAEGTGTVIADQYGLCEWKWEVGPEEGTATVNITVEQISQDLELEIR